MTRLYAAQKLLSLEAAFRRFWCGLTLHHVDPAVTLVAQRMFVCKRCGKILKP